jgi:CBS domain-containing protein
MQIADLCRDPVIVARRETTVREAAQLMRRYHVGSLIIVDIQEGSQVPAGVVTDRDIVGAVASGLDPATSTAADIMTEKVALAREDDDILDTIERMRLEDVRRMPVVNAQGQLAGIISLDELLLLVAQELSGFSRLPLVGRQQGQEFRH